MCIIFNIIRHLILKLVCAGLAINLQYHKNQKPKATNSHRGRSVEGEYCITEVEKREHQQTEHKKNLVYSSAWRISTVVQQLSSLIVCKAPILVKLLKILGSSIVGCWRCPLEGQRLCDGFWHDKVFSDIPFRAFHPKNKTRNKKGSRNHNPVMRFLNPNGREFSFCVGRRDLENGKRKQVEAQVPNLAISSTMWKKDGDASPLVQWHPQSSRCAQHSQLVRIVADLVAFRFFGGVRVAEALLSVYSTFPPDVGSWRSSWMCFDPVTIAWMAHSLRQLVEGILNAESVDLDEVINLKAYLWEELH